MTQILKVENLGITFGGLKAVQGVNLSVNQGEIIGLIGPNGAGKTTVFNMLTNVYQPTTGSIELEGRSIVGKKTYETTGMGIARTFQNIRLFKDISVIDNVKIAMDQSIHYNMMESILRLPRYWMIWRRAKRATCPTVSSASWKLRVRWQPSRSCCCWMSLPRV